MGVVISFLYLKLLNILAVADTCIRNSIKLGLIFKHITNFAVVRILSIYRNLGDIWFLTGYICKIYFGSTPQYAVCPPI